MLDHGDGIHEPGQERLRVVALAGLGQRQAWVGYADLAHGSGPTLDEVADIMLGNGLVASAELAQIEEGDQLVLFLQT